MKKVNVAIIGSGPAGYTAAIYAARANLEPVMFEGFYSGPAGGQLMTTTDVENYPGFPDGISGPRLMEEFKKQAERFGTQCITEDVKSVEHSKETFLVKGSKTHVEATAVIIATGATANRLDVPGTKEGEFWQRGVSACAVCDGAMPIFRDKHLFVIGGGDTAMEEALFLTKYAKKVFIVHRRNEFRASKVMSDRVLKHPQIEVIWGHELQKVEGDTVVQSVTLKKASGTEIQKREAGGVFFAIGHTPNVGFIKHLVPLTEQGYIDVEKGSTRTSIPGLFACGDVQDHRYRQAVTAAGSGCMAALDAEQYLSAKEHG